MDRGKRRDGIPGDDRIALLLHYDGTGFNGWQVQNSGRTVQGELERALEVLLKRKIRVTASGRTDSGVHALGQVAHFDGLPGLELGRLCQGLNGIMDKDVSVINAYRVPGDFHARYSAVRREYLYLMYNSPQRSPFTKNRAMWVPETLDLEHLRKSASFLLGEHDFASFCKKSSSDINTVRSIYEIEIVPSGRLVRMRILGNAFLHNMIRIIVGTMLQLHREKADPLEMKAILGEKDRDFGGATIPSCGLYLNRVEYSPALSTMPSAF